MKKRPEHLKVEATIPSTTNPEIQVWHRGMFPPTIIGKIALMQNPEQMLHALGKKELAGIPLSVDRQLERTVTVDRHSGQAIDISRLQAKPIDREKVSLPKDYGWYNTTKFINEFGEEEEIGWVD